MTNSPDPDPIEDDAAAEQEGILPSTKSKPAEDVDETIEKNTSVLGTPN